MAMTPALARRRRLWMALIALAVTLAAAGGVALIVWGQKTAERTAYQAAVDGPPCPPVAQAPPYADPTMLKTGAFEGARFGYLRGDMDCQTTPTGDFAGDEAAYCTFDRPGYLSVATGGATNRYLVVVGQAVVRSRGGGLWRCATKPPP